METHGGQFTRWDRELETRMLEIIKDDDEMRKVLFPRTGDKTGATSKAAKCEPIGRALFAGKEGFEFLDDDCQMTPSILKGKVKDLRQCVWLKLKR